MSETPQKVSASEIVANNDALYLEEAVADMNGNEQALESARQVSDDFANDSRNRAVLHEIALAMDESETKAALARVATVAARDTLDGGRSSVEKYFNRRDSRNPYDRRLAEAIVDANSMAVTVRDLAGTQAGEAVVKGYKNIALGHQQDAKVDGDSKIRELDWREQQPTEK